MAKQKKVAKKTATKATKKDKGTGTGKGSK